MHCYCYSECVLRNKLILSNSVCVCACVQSDYSDQLSLLYSWQEDYDRAKYYANMTRTVFYQVMTIHFTF